MADPIAQKDHKKETEFYPFSTTSLNITIKKLLTAKVTKERKRLLVTDYSVSIRGNIDSNKFQNDTLP
jgi:hypothetical protein